MIWFSITTEYHINVGGVLLMSFVCNTNPTIEMMTAVYVFFFVRLEMKRAREGSEQQNKTLWKNTGAFMKL